MECDREVLLCSGLPHCEPRFFCPLRGPIAGNACRAASPEERGDGFPSVPSLGFLPGGGVPRHSANGTRPALGPLRGILVSNSLYTFGPLHFYHFSHTHPALPMFAGIFAIGLFFGVLFRRSGNLWMVAIFHGIGNSYIEGTHPR